MEMSSTAFETKKSVLRLDRAGIFASALCILHCAAGPLIALLVPQFLLFHGGAVVHFVLLLVVFPLALLAFINCFRAHRSIATLVLGFFGVGLLLTGQVFGLLYENEARETVFTILGSSILIVGHIVNIFMMKKAAYQSCPHSHCATNSKV
jgi:hypothetical protein